MRRAERASKKAAEGQTAQFLDARHASATGPKETWVWPGSIKHEHKHHDVTCWFVKSGVWARHRLDCETDFVKSWVEKSAPSETLNDQNLQSELHDLFSLTWNKQPSPQTHQGSVYGGPGNRRLRGRKFCNHRKHISCSDPATTSIVLFWLFLDLMEKLRAVSHKVNLLCHQESVNHTQLCEYNRLETLTPP